MMNYLQVTNKKKHLFIRDFVWKDYGMYYSLPVNFRFKLTLPKMKVSYRFRGHYFEKVVKDYINVYSSGFQRDCSERLKTIPMIKGHTRALWVDEKDKYLDYDLCDMVRISYKDNGTSRFVTLSNFTQPGFWMFTFFPHKYYTSLVKNVLKKQKILYVFHNVLKFTKKKFYSFFRSNYKLIYEKKQSIFLIKLVWKTSTYIFLTSNGYRFNRRGSFWFTLGVFTGLYYIVKGNAKYGIKWSLKLSYLLLLYYNDFFLKNFKSDEVFMISFLYECFSKFIVKCLVLTFYKQRIKFRVSNKFLTRYSFYYVSKFFSIQNRFFNYIKILRTLDFSDLKFFGNYFFYFKRFNYLNNFEGSLYKDRSRLTFLDNYTYTDKILIFKTIINLLQFDYLRQSGQYLSLKKFNKYLMKKSDLLYASLNKINFKHYVFNQFYLRGFFSNNFIYNDYIDNLSLQYNGFLKFQYIYNDKILFFENNYSKSRQLFTNIINKNKLDSMYFFKCVKHNSLDNLSLFFNFSFKRKFFSYIIRFKFIINAFINILKFVKEFKFKELRLRYLKLLKKNQLSKIKIFKVLISLYRDLIVLKKNFVKKKILFKSLNKILNLVSELKEIIQLENKSIRKYFNLKNFFVKKKLTKLFLETNKLKLINKKSTKIRMLLKNSENILEKFKSRSLWKIKKNYKYLSSFKFRNIPAVTKIAYKKMAIYGNLDWEKILIANPHIVIPTDKGFSEKNLLNAYTNLNLKPKTKRESLLVYVFQKAGLVVPKHVLAKLASENVETDNSDVNSKKESLSKNVTSNWKKRRNMRVSLEKEKISKTEIDNVVK